MQFFLHCEQVSPFICGLSLLYPLAQPVCCVANLFICRVLGSHFSFFKVCDEPFNIAVEFVKVDVCQYWRNDSSLWRAAICSIPTATLEGVAQICSSRIAVLQLQATRESDL